MRRASRGGASRSGAPALVPASGSRASARGVGRLGVVAALTVYLLVLTGSPLTRSALLGWHVVAEHQGVAWVSEGGHDGEDARHAHHEPDHAPPMPESAHPHAPDHHDHTPVAAPGAAHEHEGRMHTHEPTPSEQAPAPHSAVSDHHPPAVLALALFPVARRALAPTPYLRPGRPARATDTPPPEPRA